MKHILPYYIFLLFLIFGCKDLSKEEKLPQKNFTIEQVKSVGAKYGLDSLVTEEKNSALTFFSEAELNNFFIKEKNTLDLRKETKSYLERTIWVNSFEDYLYLLDSLPLLKKSEIDAQGGLEKFDKYVDFMKKTKWHVYRFKEGGISFEYPERDNGKQNGTRMDFPN
jgi:hypothetical protein